MPSCFGTLCLKFFGSFPSPFTCFLHKLNNVTIKAILFDVSGRSVKERIQIQLRIMVKKAVVRSAFLTPEIHQ